jgi:hypothetical protein
MKFGNLIGGVVILAIGLAGGYILGFSRSTPDQIIRNPVGTVQKSVAKATGKDNFEISFEGKSGIKLDTTYYVGYDNVSDSFDVKGVTPKKVNFSAPKTAYISVRPGYTEGYEDVEIKIYRNGIECGKKPYESNTRKVTERECKPKY